MNFGLTGIGIGGLFYNGCALVVLIKEGYKKIRYRYHMHPRQLITDISVILFGIALATLITEIGLQSAIGFITTHLESYAEMSHYTPSTGLTEIRSIFVGIVALIIVLTITNLLRFIVRPEKSKKQ